jgi:hypothetical protein
MVDNEVISEISFLTSVWFIAQLDPKEIEAEER